MEFRHLQLDQDIHLLPRDLGFRWAQNKRGWALFFWEKMEIFFGRSKVIEVFKIFKEGGKKSWFIDKKTWYITGSFSIEPFKMGSETKHFIWIQWEI